VPGSSFVLATIAIESYDDRGNLVDMVIGGWSTAERVESLHSALLEAQRGLSGTWAQANPQAIRKHVEAVRRDQVWEQLDLFST
jgi:hypothetical protein